MDVRCHSFASSPEIAARKLEDGGHLFFLRDTEPRTQYPCDACGQFDFDTHLFKCMIPSCPRLFHFRCAPFSLPETAKHDWHVHPLTLTDKYGEEGLEEYYCDACEKERYLNHPVYACRECGFAAHISCAIFDVIPVLPKSHPWIIYLFNSVNYINRFFLFLVPFCYRILKYDSFQRVTRVLICCLCISGTSLHNSRV